MRNGMSWLRGVVAGGLALAGIVTGGAWCFASHGRVLLFQPKKVASDLLSNGNADELTFSGGRIVFVSTAGSGLNPDIYTATIGDHSAITGLTNVTNGSNPALDVSAHPLLSSDGTALFFRSSQNLPKTANANPTDGTNTDNSAELYRTLLTGPTVGAFQQLTADHLKWSPIPVPNPTSHPFTNTVSTVPASDGVGNYVVFSSKRNDLPGIAGQNPEGNEEIFLYDDDENKYYQITTTPAGIHNIQPVLNDNGDTILYLTNDNPEHTYQVFGIRFIIQTPENPANGNCNDGDDNDGNGLTDCHDPSCATDPACVQGTHPEGTGANAMAECTDNIDNDGNGLIDCEETTCQQLRGIGTGINPATGKEFCPPPTVNNQPTFTPTVTPSNGAVDEGKLLTIDANVQDPEGDPVMLQVQLPSGVSPTPTVSVVGCDPASQGADVCACDTTTPNQVNCPCDPTTKGCFYTGPVHAHVTWTPSFAMGTNNYDFHFLTNDDQHPSPQDNRLTVTVNNVAHLPTIQPSPLGDKTIKAGKEIVIQVRGTDLDCASLSMTASLPSGATLTTPVAGQCSTPPRSGEQSSVSAEIHWTPQASDVSATPYPISVTVTDGTNNVSAQGTITVTGNRPPVLPNLDTTVLEGTCVILSVARATDPDGDPLSYDVDAASLNNLPGDVAVFFKGTATLHWHPPINLVTQPGGTNTYTFTVLVSDGTVTQRFPVNIKVQYVSPDSAIVASAPASLSLSPGQTTTLSAMVRNLGETTWTTQSGYALAPAYTTPGLTPPAPATLPAGTSVPPAGMGTFNMTVTAPTRPGVYVMQTKMTKNGQQFGITSPYTVLNVQ